MSQARCSFRECNSLVISLPEEDAQDMVRLPRDYLMQLQMMQSVQSKDVGADAPFLVVDDIWKFDNVGVSKDIPTEVAISSSTFQYNSSTWRIEKVVKYLVCADCDRGPIGCLCTIAPQEPSPNNKPTEIYLLSIPSIQVNQK